MTVHLTPDTLRLWRERRLSPGDVVIAGDHLSVCPQCRELVTPEEHLSYEELESLAQNPVPSKHLEACPLCADEVADLRRFYLETVPGKSRRYLIPLVGVLAVAAAVVFAVLRPEPHTPSSPVIAGLTRDSSGKLAGFGTLTPAELLTVSAVLKSGHLPAATGVADLQRSKETLLSANTTAGSDFGPVSPAGIVVLTGLPQFRWTPAENPVEYNVAVYDRNFERVLQSGPVRATEWTPAKSLLAGATYSWTVTAQMRGNRVTAPRAPQPEARFRVATATEAATIEALKQRVPRSDIILAIEASKMGLAEVAEAALKDLVQQNPNSPQIAALRTN